MSLPPLPPLKRVIIGWDPYQGCAARCTEARESGTILIARLLALLSEQNKLLGGKFSHTQNQTGFSMTPLIL